MNESSHPSLRLSAFLVLGLQLCSSWQALLFLTSLFDCVSLQLQGTRADLFSHLTSLLRSFKPQERNLLASSCSTPSMVPSTDSCQCDEGVKLTSWRNLSPSTPDTPHTVPEAGTQGQGAQDPLYWQQTSGFSQEPQPPHLDLTGDSCWSSWPFLTWFLPHICRWLRDLPFSHTCVPRRPLSPVW